MKTKRFFPAGLFMLSILCFILPFADLTCNGESVSRVTGINMVTGTKLKPLKPLEQKSQQDAEQSKKNNDNDYLPVQGEILAAFILLVLAAVLNFLVRYKWLWISSLAGFAAIILLLEYEFRWGGFNPKPNDLFGMRFLFGFWLCIAFATAATAVSFINYIFYRRKIAETQTNRESMAGIEPFAPTST